MLSINSSDLSHDNNNIWIISQGRNTEVNLKGMIDGNVTGPYKEYKISDISRYLLNPHSIEVKKKLIGGEIHYKQGVLKKIGKSFRKILPNTSRRQRKRQPTSPELIISRYKLRIPPMKDPDLEAHLNQFFGLLRSYDSVPKKLALLDPHKIFEIIGICEDIGGEYYYFEF